MLRKLIYFMHIVTFSSCIYTLIAKEDQYYLMCKFFIGEAQMKYKCNAALFSLPTFNVRGKVFIQNWTKDFCNDDSKECFRHESSSTAIAVASRGNCSFDVKANTAYKMGYKALIVVNSQAKGEEVFPMGSSAPDYSAQIPIIMISYPSWQHLYSSSSEGSGQEVIAHLSKGIPQDHMKSSEHRGDNKPKLFSNFVMNALAVSCGLVLIVLATTWFLAIWEIVFKFPSITAPSPSVSGENRISSSTVALVCMIGVVVVFPIALYVRLGTLRELLLTPAEVMVDSHILGGRSSLFHTYNHRETDEVIFETLVDSVIKQWSDYSLRGKPIIDSLRLAKENYNDALFIHPPFFVYVSAFLYSYFSIPLPIIPLLFHFATAAMIPIVLSCILQSGCGESPTHALITSNFNFNFNLRKCFSPMAVNAMVVFLCCPIAAFCSQKFWIDNALLMTTTLAASVHMLLCNVGPSVVPDFRNQVRVTVVSNSVVKQMLSGFVFGFIALNTKITALALLPFLLSWTIFYRIESAFSSRRIFLWSLSTDIIIHIGAFVATTAIAYAPWVYLYWSYTGRLSPNAWPSKEMLENSPFVRAAVQKPYHTYFSTLLKFAPMHLYGLFFFTLAAVVVACAIAAAFSRLFYTDNNSETTPNEDDVSDHDTERNKIYSILRRNAVLVKLCVFSLWPLSFLVGLTLLGSAGAGFQARFLLPILPATAILSSATVYVLQGYCMLIAKPMDSIFSVIVATSVSFFDVLLFIAVIHLCVYGMMFAPLFGDLDLSIIDMISAMHKNPLSSPSSQESWQKILQYLRHFGLDR